MPRSTKKLLPERYFVHTCLKFGKNEKQNQRNIIEVEVRIPPVARPALPGAAAREKLFFKNRSIFRKILRNQKKLKFIEEVKK